MLAYFGTENEVVYHVGGLILEQRMRSYIMYASLFWKKEWRCISFILAYFRTENGDIYHVC